MVVVARAGAGLGAFVVPAGEAGLVPVRSLDASRPLGTATLDRVFVADDRALGEPGSAASTLGVTRAIQEATVGDRARDGRHLRRALPNGPVLRQGSPAVRGGHRVLPGGEAQDDQYVPRHRAGPFAVLLRGGRHGRGHARPRPPRWPWPRPPATIASAWCVASRPVLRRHRVHLGARRPSLRQAGQDQRGSVRGCAEHSVAVAAALGVASRKGADWRHAPGGVPDRRPRPLPASRGWLVPTHLGGRGGGGERPRGSAIYYLLLEGEFSAPHRIDATELWHFYAGDPLELTLEPPDGRHACRSSGPTWRRTCAPGRRRAGGLAVGPATGRYTLVGATVSPAFRFEGFDSVRAPPTRTERRGKPFSPSHAGR